MVHLSKFADSGQLIDITEWVTVGEQVWVRLVSIDPQGRYVVSMRCVNQYTGEPKPIRVAPAPERDHLARKAHGFRCER
jgi:predicted RNA-binding protein with RPS1 domain